MLEAQQRDSIKQKDIEQVVLIGYGKQKKSDLTGSVVSVTAKDFNGGSTSPEQLIQGKTPGVQIISVWFMTILFNFPMAFFWQICYI